MWQNQQPQLGQFSQPNYAVANRTNPFAVNSPPSDFSQHSSGFQPAGPRPSFLVSGYQQPGFSAQKSFGGAPRPAARPTCRLCQGVFLSFDDLKRHIKEENHYDTAAPSFSGPVVQGGGSNPPRGAAPRPPFQKNPSQPKFMDYSGTPPPAAMERRPRPQNISTRPPRGASYQHTASVRSSDVQMTMEEADDAVDGPIVQSVLKSATADSSDDEDPGMMTDRQDDALNLSCSSVEGAAYSTTQPMQDSTLRAEAPTWVQGAFAAKLAEKRAVVTATAKEAPIPALPTIEATVAAPPVRKALTRVQPTVIAAPSPHEWTAVSGQDMSSADAAVDVKKARGTCEDMCPEEERTKRKNEYDIHKLEQLHPEVTGSKTLQDTMVKKFQRSSADHELQIASLMRTPYALFRTIVYMEDSIMEKYLEGVDPRCNEEPTSLFVYLFVWDRCRMIAKDFTLQQSAVPFSRIWVECHERMARWFVLMDHRMQADADFVTGHAQQNGEQLNNLLKTLHGYYFRPDAAAVEMPHRSEFIGYFIIFQLGNAGEVTKYIQKLPDDVLRTPEIGFALQVWSAIKTENYAKFFKLLEKATVLQASLMHRYVGNMRLVGFRKIVKTYCMSSKSGSDMPLEDLLGMFKFESYDDAVEFIEHIGLHYSVFDELDADGEPYQRVVVRFESQNVDSLLPVDKNERPIYPRTNYMLYHIDEAKCANFTTAEVCRGYASSRYVFDDEAYLRSRGAVMRDKVNDAQQVDESSSDAVSSQYASTDKSKQQKPASTALSVSASSRTSSKAQEIPVEKNAAATAPKLAVETKRAAVSPRPTAPAPIKSDTSSSSTPPPAAPSPHSKSSMSSEARAKLMSGSLSSGRAEKSPSPVMPTSAELDAEAAAAGRQKKPTASKPSAGIATVAAAADDKWSKAFSTMGDSKSSWVSSTTAAATGPATAWPPAVSAAPPAFPGVSSVSSAVAAEAKASWPPLMQTTGVLSTFTFPSAPAAFSPPAPVMFPITKPAEKASAVTVVAASSKLTPVKIPEQPVASTPVQPAPSAPVATPRSAVDPQKLEKFIRKAVRSQRRASLLKVFSVWKKAYLVLQAKRRKQWLSVVLSRWKRAYAKVLRRRAQLVPELQIIQMKILSDDASLSFEQLSLGGEMSTHDAGSTGTARVWEHYIPLHHRNKRQSAKRKKLEAEALALKGPNQRLLSDYGAEGDGMRSDTLLKSVCEQVGRVLLAKQDRQLMRDFGYPVNSVSGSGSESVSSAIRSAFPAWKSDVFLKVAVVSTATQSAVCTVSDDLLLSMLRAVLCNERGIDSNFSHLHVKLASAESSSSIASAGTAGSSAAEVQQLTKNQKHKLGKKRDTVLRQLCLEKRTAQRIGLVRQLIGSSTTACSLSVIDICAAQAERSRDAVGEAMRGCGGALILFPLSLLQASNTAQQRQLSSVLQQITQCIRGELPMVLVVLSAAEGATDSFAWREIDDTSNDSSSEDYGEVRKEAVAAMRFLASLLDVETFIQHIFVAHLTTTATNATAAYASKCCDCVAQAMNALAASTAALPYMSRQRVEDFIVQHIARETAAEHSALSVSLAASSSSHQRDVAFVIAQAIHSTWQERLVQFNRALNTCQEQLQFLRSKHEQLYPSFPATDFQLQSKNATVPAVRNALFLVSSENKLEMQWNCDPQTNMLPVNWERQFASDLPSLLQHCDALKLPPYELELAPGLYRNPLAVVLSYVQTFLETAAASLGAKDDAVSVCASIVPDLQQHAERMLGSGTLDARNAAYSTVLLSIRLVNSVLDERVARMCAASEVTSFYALVDKESFKNMTQPAVAHNPETLRSVKVDLVPQIEAPPLPTSPQRHTVKRALHTEMEQQSSLGVPIEDLILQKRKKVDQQRSYHGEPAPPDRKTVQLLTAIQHERAAGAHLMSYLEAATKNSQKGSRDGEEGRPPVEDIMRNPLQFVMQCRQERETGLFIEK